RWLAPLAIAASLLLMVVVAFWRRPSPAPEVTAVSPPTPSVARVEASPVPTTPPTPGTVGRPPTGRPPGSAATPVVLALAPVLLRGQGNPAELRVPPGTATVTLELEGDPAALPPGASRFEVVVQTVEGAHMWSGGARRRDDPARTSLLTSVEVPATRLPRGDYLVTLSSR